MNVCVVAISGMKIAMLQTIRNTALAAAENCVMMKEVCDMRMCATDITELSINKTHCDWIIQNATELKALFSYNSDRMIEMNKTRALSAIDTAIDSFRELRLYFDNESEV